MKYHCWNIGSWQDSAVVQLQKAGYNPLTARILSSRGYQTPQEAKHYLSCEEVLPDPLQMKQMEAAADRVRLAIKQREHIAVYGDYDVDGITATCLMTDFLRSMNVTCTPYIPGRVGEGYGLNEMAIRYLSSIGVDLIVTVDCGITAMKEAMLCKELGIDLIVTDHHECKDELPDAVAVVDPCRPDRTYPHSDLCGVGVAFKLASAVWGNQEEILRRYADLICLGTIADVMPLQGENRNFVVRGLRAMQQAKRLGLAALIRECGCDQQEITANTVGYVLAPRINAAGRMGQVELATELFLTQNANTATRCAVALCELNRERQRVETEIYEQAIAKLAHSTMPLGAVVLADERWHQGVVGIVASRLAEECACPTFLICLDGEHGKASSRSFGGFNLFTSLKEHSHLLENYGGHELAAGFTIERKNIDEFRQQMTACAQSFAQSDEANAALECDCAITPPLLTLDNIIGLDQLEPCGSGCPRPTLCMQALTVDQMSEVGGGKHLRLRLKAEDGTMISAIFFSTNALRAAISVGDVVDVAFNPQINEFRGNRTVQMNVIDIRLHGEVRDEILAARSIYRKYRQNHALSLAEIDELLPIRQDFATIWRYLSAQNEQGRIEDELCCLSRKIGRTGNYALSILKTRICLDVFAEQGLISMEEHPSCLTITVHPARSKVDLTKSAIICELINRKKGDSHGRFSDPL